MKRKKKLDWGKCPPKPYYTYIHGKVSRHDGPVNGKISTFNSGPFGLKFVGTTPPSYVVEKMFDGLRKHGCLHHYIFHMRFKDKEKTSWTTNVWKGLGKILNLIFGGWSRRG